MSIDKVRYNIISILLYRLIRQLLQFRGQSLTINKRLDGIL